MKDCQKDADRIHRAADLLARSNSQRIAMRQPKDGFGLGERATMMVEMRKIEKMLMGNETKMPNIVEPRLRLSDEPWGRRL